MPGVRRMAARGKFAIASSKPGFKVFQVFVCLSLAQDTALGPIGEDLACSLPTGCCHEVHCLRVAYRLPATFTLHMVPQLSEFCLPVNSPYLVEPGFLFQQVCACQLHP